MEETVPKIRVKSQVDQSVIEISKNSAKKSEMLKGLLNDYPDSPELTVNEVNGKALEKIKEYLDHYEKEEPKDVQRPFKSKDLKECLTEFDYNFVNSFENYDELKNLLLAANFMNIKSLINLLSATIAHKIKGFNTSDVRNTFGIKELNQEEEKLFNDDIKYIEEKGFKDL